MRAYLNGEAAALLHMPSTFASSRPKESVVHTTAVRHGRPCWCTLHRVVLAIVLSYFRPSTASALRRCRAVDVLNAAGCSFPECRHQERSHSCLKQVNLPAWCMVS